MAKWHILVRVHILLLTYSMFKLLIYRICLDTCVKRMAPNVQGLGSDNIAVSFI